MEEDDNDTLKFLLPPDETELLRSKKFSYPTNIFSSLTFHWVYDTIKKSKRSKNLQFSSLGDVSPNFQSEQMFKNVENKWHDKYYYLLEKNNNEQKKSIYPLFMTLIKANYGRIIIGAILYITISVLDFLGIIMFKELLSKFKEYSTDSNDDKDETKITFLKSLSLYELISLMIIHKIISLVLNRQSQFIAELIGIRSTTQLSLLIYDKLLKIPTYGMSEFNEGKIINLFQTDTETFAEFYVNAGLIIVVPFKVIYSCY